MSAEKCSICGKIKAVSIFLALKKGGNAPLCKECSDVWADSDLEWHGELNELESLKTTE